MYVIQVSPLLKGANLESLTYFSSVPYELGTLLRIPVRNSEATGMVLSVKPVSAARTAVRAATFSLRRLPEQTGGASISPLLIKTATALMDEVPASFGSILFSLLPPEVRDGSEPYPFSPESSTEKKDASVSVITGVTEERWRTYKSRVREAFAHRGSVLFVSPTARAAASAAERLLPGIKDRAVIFSPALTAKSLRKAFQSVTDLSTSKLIIVTPGYAFIDRHDITDIIIDESRSQHYCSRTRPYLDFKAALLKMAFIGGRNVLLGDLLHKAEDEYKRRTEEYMTEGEEQLRVAFPNEVKLIVSKDKASGDTPFELISPESKSALKKTLKERKNTFVYAARRGLAPVVACMDCGHIFRCPHSGTPYSLFRTFKNGEEKRWFLSSVSGRRVKAAENCPECGSWRLKERGIGIQYIEEELKKTFPPEKIFIFDHSTASTARKAATIIGDFYEEKGAVLVGTAMAIPYLEKPVSLGLVTSLDAARAVPTWRVDEDCLALLLALRENVEEELIIQSRSEPDELMDYLRKGQISNFFTDELKLREEVGYPPFSHLVHLTMKGKEEAVKAIENDVSALLSDFNFSFYSSPDSTLENTTRYALLRISNDKWPNKTLMEVLRSLPQSVKVEINPDRLV